MCLVYSICYHMYVVITTKQIAFLIPVMLGGIQQIPELLAMVDLTDASSKKLGAYSDGMKQRILIA